MLENISKIIILTVLMLWLMVMIQFIFKALRNKYAPVKAVKAVLINKHMISTFSKYAGNGSRKKYVIVFSAEGKKMSFYVSEFSYRGYKIHETGTLKYKGDKIIDFS